VSDDDGVRAGQDDELLDGEVPASAGRVEVVPDTTTEFNCRGGSRASIGAAALAALPRVFLQRVPL